MRLLHFTAVPLATNVKFHALPAPVTAKPGNLQQHPEAASVGQEPTLMLASYPGQRTAARQQGQLVEAEGSQSCAR